MIPVRTRRRSRRGVMPGIPARSLRKDWRRGSESNRRIKVLQTSPLPLGYRALPLKLAFRAEKVHVRQRPAPKNAKSPRSGAGLPAKLWSGRRDLNPRLRPWQGRTLPLSYSRSTQPIINNPPHPGNAAPTHLATSAGSVLRPGSSLLHGRIGFGRDLVAHVP